MLVYVYKYIFVDKIHIPAQILNPINIALGITYEVHGIEFSKYHLFFCIKKELPFNIYVFSTAWRPWLIEKLLTSGFAYTEVYETWIAPF